MSPFMFNYSYILHNSSVMSYSQNVLACTCYCSNVAWISINNEKILVNKKVIFLLIHESICTEEESHVSGAE